MQALNPSLTLRLSSNLQEATDEHATALERLSSGLRVNRAADGPADLGIGTEFEKRHRSSVVLQRNIGAASDMVQVAEGGMKEIQAIVVRMRELAMQSANGTYNDEQRALIELEFRQQSESVSQVAKSTTYNGWNLLYQEKIDVVFVVDTSASMSGEIAAASASIAAFQSGLEAQGYDVKFGLVSILTSNDPIDGTEMILDIGNGDIASALSTLPTPGGSIDPYAGLLNAAGVIDTVGTKEPDAVTWREDAEKMMIYLSDTMRETSLIPEDETQTAALLAGANVTVNVIGTNLTNSATDEIASATGGSFYAISNGSGVAPALTAIGVDLATNSNVEQEENSISFLVGLDGDETLEPGLPRDMSSPTLGLSALSVVTPTEARAALDALPDILHSISSARADMGAVLNRLESIANNAANRDLNEVRAGGRVMDADVAAETARLTRSNLLVQQGASIASKLGAIQRDFVLTLLSST